MTMALEGVRVIDMTHVQSGPSATQLLAWLGADVIKVELPGRGDVTREQLRDIPDADSLYFTMLNCNKRSVTVNMKSEGGREVFARLVRDADVVVENFGPGVLDRLGFPWEKLHELNARLILASIKGFGPGRYADFKAYEVVAQAMGGAMSTTGFADGPPTATGAQIGDSGSGVHLVVGIIAALYQRVSTGRGQRVSVAMQDAVLNLCRVKLRDQQRLAAGPLEEYPNSPSGGSFGGSIGGSAGGSAGDEVPRSGNASGGGQPGWAVRCAPGGPNDYIYVIIQPPGWAPITSLIGAPELADDPEWATPEARLPKLDKVFELIEAWTLGLTKWEVMDKLNACGVPCGPILSTRELIEDETLASLGSVVSVSHPERGSFKTVGCPVRLSDSPVTVSSSPLLGEHTDEVLRGLGYQPGEIASLRETGAI
jgi:formyl-CoA transferase